MIKIDNKILVTLVKSLIYLNCVIKKDFNLIIKILDFLYYFSISLRVSTKASFSSLLKFLTASIN